MPLLHYLLPIRNSWAVSYAPLNRPTSTDNLGEYRLTSTPAKALSTDQLLALLASPASSR